MPPGISPVYLGVSMRLASVGVVRVTAVAAVIFLAGCSLAAPRSETINIIPSTPKASVFVNGNLIGTGTQAVDLSRGQAHSVLVRCGDSAGTGSIDRKISGTGIADIIGGLVFLIPFLGFTSDGAFDLSPNTLSVAVPDSSGC